MSQHVMESPSKRVRHDSTDSSYLGHHAPESPIQQTSTGANPDQSLFGFEFSDTPTFGGGVTPSLPYLPSQVPNSKDWIMSPTAAFSTLPEGFGADPLSPGFSAGVPSHTGALKGSNHPRGHRNAKRGAGAGASSSLYHDDEDFGELGMGAGIAGMAGMAGPLDGDLSGGNALSPGAVIMDEESQEHLSTNRRALADILSRKSRTGRATPDVMASDEHEGTRHGFNNSNNYNNCSDAFINSNNKNTNSSSSTSSNNSGYLSSFSHLSGALSGNSGSLLENNNNNHNNHHNESTLSVRASWNKAPQEEIKTEKGTRAKQKANITSKSSNLNLANEANISNSANVKEESDDDCNSNQHSQQSAASSHMAGVLAITAAAETLPFPSSDERIAAGTNKGKKGKAKRSYTTSLNSNSKPFPSEVGEQQGEHSNQSCESNSSGHSAVGSAALAGLNAAEVTGSIQASFMAAYGTPAMKLTSSIASASSTNKPITCNCKRSRCLKMYCDCFRLTIYCKDTCRCKECANLESRAVERQAAIASIVDRNPEAFKPRVTADPTSNSKAHLTGCHCRKSSCLKKYCECFTGAVPCGERCRCLDCKNGPAIYGAGGNGSSGNADLQHRLSLSAALSAAGVDRSNNNRRKDSIGSEGNSMDVMSAIMNDKSKRQYGKSAAATSSSGLGATSTLAAASSSSSVLRSELVGSHGLGSPHMSPHGHLNMGNINNMGSFGTLAMGLGGAPYFDPEASNMSHMTTQSLSYSNDAFGRPMYGNYTARLSKSDSKLAFSPPRPGTDPSSGANSNRSVLDNEDAAEVLSAMNSPNAYMSAPAFGGIGSNSVTGGGAGGAGGEVPAYRYRDNVMSSVDTNYTSHSPSHSQDHSTGSRMFPRGLLRADLENADDEEEDDILRPLRDTSATGSAPGSARVRDMARRTASLGLEGHHGNMNIDTEDSLVVSSLGSTSAMVSNLSDNSNRFTPYSSPVKGRRPITENMVLSPTLLDLASICEQKAEEEEERKQQLTSPDRTRSYP